MLPGMALLIKSTRARLSRWTASSRLVAGTSRVRTAPHWVLNAEATAPASLREATVNFIVPNDSKLEEHCEHLARAASACV